MVLRQLSRIDISHQSTSEEKHGRLLKRGSGDCRTFLCSVTRAAKERQDYRTLPCSVSEQLKETGTFPVSLDILVLAASSKIKVNCHIRVFSHGVQSH